MSDNNQLEWEEIETEHIIQDRWIDFKKSTFKLPNGKVFQPFYTYSRRDYVVIVATDEEDNYLCVRQFRQGIREVTTEFPAGGIECKGDKEYKNDDNEFSEDTLEAAKRELLEETGYESKEWEHLITIPSNATIADNYAHIYRAKNCKKVKDQDLDETEFLNVIKLKDQEIKELIKEGKFQQAMHITALLMSTSF